eukprot:275476-Rhodomonas_salina.4
MFRTTVRILPYLASPIPISTPTPVPELVVGQRFRGRELTDPSRKEWFLTFDRPALPRPR